MALKGFSAVELLKLLDVDIDKNYANIALEAIIEYLFTDDRGIAQGGNVVFDEILDFRYVYPVFKQLYQIDLINDDITYFQYLTMLENAMTQENILSRVISIRNMEMPKNAKEAMKVIELKSKYNLKSEKPNLKGLFSSLKGVRSSGRRKDRI